MASEDDRPEPLALDLDEEPGNGSLYTAPEVLAPAGFALALASLLGFGLMTGNVLLALSDAQQGPPSALLQVLAGLLGAALGVVPLVMGLIAVRDLLEDDPLWVSGLARATVILGAIVVVLRLFHTAVAALSGGSPYFGY
jgi:hypothetical protein